MEGRLITANAGRWEREPRSTGDVGEKQEGQSTTVTRREGCDDKAQELQLQMKSFYVRAGEVLIERQRWEARGRQHVCSFGTCLALQFRGRQGMNSDLPGGPNFFTRLWETNDYCVVMLKKKCC